ncbi:MAG: UDP-N-acetylmuramate dehydrogenase [Candidatus Omnitrophica bacterium]|nr:UDP-N-acetylmuramate dehydrogenase [Candidatus Omnitrophota bacterium]
MNKTDKVFKDELSRLGDVRQDVFLANFTTFRIGGQAEIFFAALVQENLFQALKLFKEAKLKYYILGGGSNILISSDGIKGVAVKLGFYEFQKLDEPNNFYVGASTRLTGLLGVSLEKRLGGLEFLAGLPATLGGALVNNASFKDRDIFSLVKKVKVFDPEKNEVFLLDKNEIDRGYRYCSLKKFIVLGAELVFYDKSYLKIREDIKEAMVYRILTQEVGSFSAGCVFKNPEQGLSAARLIEEAGLKGLKKGDAMVSLKHANYIINKGRAKSCDVVFLIELIKEKVYNKFGIFLDEEIERWQC